MKMSNLTIGKQAPVVRSKTFSEDTHRGGGGGGGGGGGEAAAAAQDNSRLAVIEESKEDNNNANEIQPQDELDKNLSAEELDSDELDGNLDLSDNENGDAARENLRKRTDAENKPKKEKIVSEFDTNIFKVSLDCIQDRG